MCVEFCHELRKFRPFPDPPVSHPGWSLFKRIQPWWTPAIPDLQKTKEKGFDEQLWCCSEDDEKGIWWSGKGGCVSVTSDEVFDSTECPLTQKLGQRWELFQQDQKIFKYVQILYLQFIIHKLWNYSIISSEWCQFKIYIGILTSTCIHLFVSGPMKSQERLMHNLIILYLQHLHRGSSRKALKILKSIIFNSHLITTIQKKVITEISYDIYTSHQQLQFYLVNLLKINAKYTQKCQIPSQTMKCLLNGHLHFKK